MIWTSRPTLLALTCALLAPIAACGAVYPEIASPLKMAPPGKTLRPAAPDDLLFLGFLSAEIPAKTRDGRSWDSVGGSAPDAYAVFFLNDVELFRTPVEANSLQPTWPNQKRDNFRVPAGSAVRIEMWDSNAVHHHPICVKRLTNIHRYSADGVLKIDCSSGARMSLLVEPAHAKLGLGLYYELRSSKIVISRILKESPSARAGLKKGMEIVSIQEREVAGMEDGEAQSLINANAPTGVTLGVKVGPAEVKSFSLKIGPVYPIHGEIKRP